MESDCQLKQLIPPVVNHERPESGLGLPCGVLDSRCNFSFETLKRSVHSNQWKVQHCFSPLW